VTLSDSESESREEELKNNDLESIQNFYDRCEKQNLTLLKKSMQR
jgi:hypothetical protein